MPVWIPSERCAESVRARVVAEVGAGAMPDPAAIQKAFEDSDDEKMTEIRGGEKISEHLADGMVPLHGIHVHGFPNLFINGLIQGANLISNITHNLTDTGTTIASVVRHALDVGADEVEVSGPVAFFQYIDEWRKSGRFAGLEFRKRAEARRGVAAQ